MTSKDEHVRNAVGALLDGESRVTVMFVGEGRALFMLADERDGFTAVVDKQGLEAIGSVVRTALERIEEE